MSEKEEEMAYCEPCARLAFAAWKGWPQRDAIPLLSRVEAGGCSVCGGKEKLSSQRINWKSPLGKSDFCLLVIDGGSECAWGRPYYAEETCPKCGGRAIISEMGTPSGNANYARNCATCGAQKIQGSTRLRDNGGPAQ